MAVQDDETSLVTAASPVERAHIEFVPGPDPAGLEAHGIGEDRRAGRARVPSTVAPCTRHPGARRPDSGVHRPSGHPAPPHSHRCTGPASATRPSWAGHRVADTPPATPASAALQGRISAARLADHDCRGRVRPGRSFDHVPAPPLREVKKTRRVTTAVPFPPDCRFCRTPLRDWRPTPGQASSSAVLRSGVMGR